MRVGLFPGQGIDAKVIRRALDPDDPRVVRACEVLGFDLPRRVEQIARRARGVVPTALAQPAIFVAGLVSHERHAERGDRFGAYVGHSLGEYTALVAAGSVPFEHGLKLVAARGRAMQDATARHSGGMAAVIGMSPDRVEAIARAHDLTVANDNSPSQVVIAGTVEALGAAAGDVRAAGGRCALLPVEGAFHTDAMAPAASRLAAVLMSTDVRSPSVPVISNVTARPYRAPGEIRKLLVTQLTSRVRFRESVEWLLRRGATEFADLGPGEIVGRLARSIASRSEEEVVA